MLSLHLIVIFLGLRMSFPDSITYKIRMPAGGFLEHKLGQIAWLDWRRVKWNQQVLVSCRNLRSIMTDILVVSSA